LYPNASYPLPLLGAIQVAVIEGTEVEVKAKLAGDYGTFAKRTLIEGDKSDSPISLTELT